MGIIPKRHHFVAEMHQKRFTDERDRLYFYDTRYPGEGVRRTTAGNLFCEGHLYSEIANDGTKDPSLEKAFSSLEARIAPIIDKVIGAARKNQPPHLTLGEKATWDRFFVLQYKRVPDVHKSIAPASAAEDQLDQLLSELVQRFPERRAEIDALSTPEERRRLIHNSKVGALAQPSLMVEQVLARRGLGILRIARPGRAFIIGSNPVVRFTRPGRTHIIDPEVEVWLPVSSDVAVGLGALPGTESFLALSELSWIRHINEGIARQSTMYAGRSKELLCSLSGRPYRGRD